MSSIHFLILGNGFVSQTLAPFLTERGHVVSIVDFPEVDITSLASVRSTLAATKADYVINAAAYTNTHAAEQDAAEADRCFRVNVEGPANLLVACEEAGVAWLHISTGMMFDGTPPRTDGWNETDTPHPASWYARTKLWADLLLLPEAKKNSILITRIHTPIGRREDPKNLLTKLRNFSSAVTDESSFTVLEDYCEAVLSLITNKHSGLYHVVNPGITSFYNIMRAMQERGLIQKDTEIATQTMEQLNANRGTKAYQPVSILSPAKLATTGISLPAIADRINTLLP